jgi:hypothetical protein
MHWDRDKGRWTSRTQQAKERKETEMSLFRKKQKTAIEPSAFDSIPTEVQGKLIEDVLLISRTILEWPKLVPQELHKPIIDEVVSVARKTGLKLVSAAMSGDAESAVDAFKGVQIPNLLMQAFHAVKLALSNEGGTDGTAA